MTQFHCTYSEDLDAEFEALVTSLGGSCDPARKTTEGGHIGQYVSIPNDKAVEFHRTAVGNLVIVQRI